MPPPMSRSFSSCSLSIVMCLITLIFASNSSFENLSNLKSLSSYYILRRWWQVRSATSRQEMTWFSLFWRNVWSFWFFICSSVKRSKVIRKCLSVWPILTCNDYINYRLAFAFSPYLSLAFSTWSSWMRSLSIWFSSAKLTERSMEACWCDISFSWDWTIPLI